MVTEKEAMPSKKTAVVELEHPKPTTTVDSKKTKTPRSRDKPAAKEKPVKPQQSKTQVPSPRPQPSAEVKVGGQKAVKRLREQSRVNWKPIEGKRRVVHCLVGIDPSFYYAYLPPDLPALPLNVKALV